MRAAGEPGSVRRTPRRAVPSIRSSPGPSPLQALLMFFFDQFESCPSLHKVLGVRLVPFWAIFRGYPSTIATSRPRRSFIQGGTPPRSRSPKTPAFDAADLQGVPPSTTMIFRVRW